MTDDITELLAPHSDSENEEFQDEIIDSDGGSGSESDSEPDKSDKNGKPSGGASGGDPDDEFPALDSDDEVYFRQAETRAAVKKSSSTFVGMGLNKLLLTNIQRKGFKLPTPIQRKAIPPILDGQDVVGMARTGSGKTAAFVLPMIQRLKAHSSKIGVRTLILSPSRELAMQTLRVVKDFSKKTDLRSVLLVGGDSLEDQFGFMMNNPDIVVATPGRFMHLKVEMGLDLSSVEYIVFDEADRLFEMGFADQLNEILASLPEIRQTLLFSATLPRTLVDFAKAGLRNPLLVRLDADQKISDQLQMGFFAVNDMERDALLLYILQDIIKMPAMTDEQREYLEKRANIVYDDDGKLEKRERLPSASELPSPQATVVFVPTKHHVEYVAQLLKHEGYAVSMLYGSLDQSARREQLYLFKAGKTSIMVVTDVAARGVDIPMLANVVNYNMTTSARVFIHRVGRTARAGRQGWAYSIVRPSDLPYLADLEVFLGRKITTQGRTATKDFTQKLVIGAPLRSGLEFHHEQVQALLARNFDLHEQQRVASRGEKLYLKSREAASKQGVHRARELAEAAWETVHPLAAASESAGSVLSGEKAKESLLALMSQRRVKETVFEIKKNSMGSAAQLMARRRQQIAPIQDRARKRKETAKAEQLARANGTYESSDDGDDYENDGNDDNDEMQGVVVSESTPKPAGLGRFQDPKFYMSHQEPMSSLQDRGYALQGSAGFADAARDVSFGFGDEGKDFSSKQITRWDKKKGKYINSSGENKVKYIRGEDGRKIPASLKSGRFDAWKSAHKVADMGRMETDGGSGGRAGGPSRFKHRKERAPKAADKARDDYKVRKDKVSKAVEKGLRVKGHNVPGTGINSTSTIQKQRAQKQKRWDKSNQPGSRKKRVERR